MGKNLKLILVSLLLVAAMMLALELFIKVAFPQINLSGTSSSLLKDSVYFKSPGLMPNSSGTSNGVKKEVDQKGFWKYNTIKNPKVVKNKWLFLGDSATMGIGVENDSTFAGILNNELDSVQILNNSLIGYSGYDYLDVIKKIFEHGSNRFNVKKIVIFWCLNDVYDFYPTSNSPDFSNRGFIGNISTFLSMHSKTWHLLKELFSDRQKDYFLYDNQFYKSANKLFNSAVSNIAQCSETAARLGILFDVVILPYEFQIRNFNRKELFLPQQLLMNELNNKHINCFDVSKYLGPFAHDSKSLYLFGDGIHFSKTGHRVIAKILSEHFF